MRNHAEDGYTSEDMDGRPYPENEHIGFLQPYSRKSHPTDGLWKRNDSSDMSHDDKGSRSQSKANGEANGDAVLCGGFIC